MVTGDKVIANKKQQLLDELKDRILADGVCQEMIPWAKQLVMGCGNPDADIVFIGEAPGKKEDATGEPFVGASGKLLDELLDSIGMKRSDIYITNIVKYRPRDNRDPFPAEKAAFLPYLEAQLDIIQPKLLVTLGRHSMNCFLPDLQIGRVHGRLQQGEKWAIFPIYHPAATIYNRKLRTAIQQDFARLPEILAKLQ